MGVLTPTVQGNTTSATPGLEPGRSLYSRRHHPSCGQARGASSLTNQSPCGDRGVLAPSRGQQHVSNVPCGKSQRGYATRRQVLPRTTLLIAAWLTPYSAARYA